MTGNDKPLVLVTIAGGGWYNESCKILQRFPADRFRIAYVYGYYAHDYSGRTIPMPQPGERYGVYYHLGPTRKHLGQHLANAARLTRSFVEAYRLLRRLRPQAIFTVGSAIALPLFLAARCLGIRRIYVESITRAQQPSLTARVLDRLSLASRLYVQWPRLQQQLSNATYAGGVL